MNVNGLFKTLLGRTYCGKESDMCQFCTAHGEGQKWYLQMKNYAEILLHEEISATQDVVSSI